MVCERCLNFFFSFRSRSTYTIHRDHNKIPCELARHEKNTAFSLDYCYYFSCQRHNGQHHNPMHMVLIGYSSCVISNEFYFDIFGIALSSPKCDFGLGPIPTSLPRSKLSGKYSMEFNVCIFL